MRRRDDRVSQWLRTHVMSLPVPAGSQGPALFGMFMAFCRWVNWPPTIEEVLQRGLWPTAHPHWREIGDVIDQRVKRGLQAWTGAYMVNAVYKLSGQYFSTYDKGRFIAEIVVKREMLDKSHALRQALRENSRKAVHDVLDSCYGWGSFMSGQVADDWTWTSLLKSPADDMTWAPQGPGSLRGLNRIARLPLAKHHKPDEWCELLQDIRLGCLAELGPEFQDMTLMDFQNCLCEFDKYERVRLGEGRPRSLYKPETRY